jgi:DNA-binding NtrC family response regulator
MIRVLLVEDDPLIGRSTARILSRHVDVVDVVSDVPTALRRIELDDIEVVVTDYDLGAGPNGLDLLHTVHEQWPAVRVIMASGSIDRRLREEAASSGARAVFEKPVDLKRLVAEIQRS